MEEYLDVDPLYLSYSFLRRAKFADANRIARHDPSLLVTQIKIGFGDECIENRATEPKETISGVFVPFTKDLNNNAKQNDDANKNIDNNNSKQEQLLPAKRVVNQPVVAARRILSSTIQLDSIASSSHQDNLELTETDIDFLLHDPEESDFEQNKEKLHGKLGTTTMGTSVKGLGAEQISRAVSKSTLKSGFLQSHGLNVSRMNSGGMVQASMSRMVRPDSNAISLSRVGFAASRAGVASKTRMFSGGSGGGALKSALIRSRSSINNSDVNRCTNVSSGMISQALIAASSSDIATFSGYSGAYAADESLLLQINDSFASGPWHSICNYKDYQCLYYEINRKHEQDKENLVDDKRMVDEINRNKFIVKSLKFDESVKKSDIDERKLFWIVDWYFQMVNALRFKANSSNKAAESVIGPFSSLYILRVLVPMVLTFQAPDLRVDNALAVLPNPSAAFKMQAELKNEIDSFRIKFAMEINKDDKNIGLLTEMQKFSSSNDALDTFLLVLKPTLSKIMHGIFPDIQAQDESCIIATDKTKGDGDNIREGSSNNSIQKSSLLSAVAYANGTDRKQNSSNSNIANKNRTSLMVTFSLTKAISCFIKGDLQEFKAIIKNTALKNTTHQLEIALAFIRVMVTIKSCFEIVISAPDSVSDSAIEKLLAVASNISDFYEFEFINTVPMLQSIDNYSEIIRRRVFNPGTHRLAESGNRGDGAITDINEQSKSTAARLIENISHGYASMLYYLKRNGQTKSISPMIMKEANTILSSIIVAYENIETLAVSSVHLLDSMNTVLTAQVAFLSTIPDISRIPEAASLWTNLGVSYMLQNDSTQALKSLLSALKLIEVYLYNSNQDELQCHCCDGTAESADAARVQKKRAALLYSDIYYNIGCVMLRSKNYEYALKAFSTAILKNRSNVEALYNLSLIYFSVLNEKPKGIAFMEMAKKVDTGINFSLTTFLNRSLVLIYLKVKNLTKAREAATVLQTSADPQSLELFTYVNSLTDFDSFN